MYLLTQAQQMLATLNTIKTDGQIYGGTVPVDEKARRRAKNKAARRSRRINRSR